MQTACVLKNPTGTRSARFATCDDVPWIVAQVLERIPAAKCWSESAASGWARWFVDHRLAGILEGNGVCIGLLMGRPCRNVSRAGSEYYYYERGGEIAWVDVLIAPDHRAIRLLWDFARAFAFSPDSVAYRNKNRTGARMFSSEPLRGHFQTELN